MSAEQQQQDCEDRALRLAAFARTRDRYPSAAHLRQAVSELHTLARGWQGPHLAQPQGSPATARDSAVGFDGIADALDGMATELRSQAEAIRQAMEADAGEATAEKIDAFVGLTTLESRGVRIAADALRSYATGLEGGQASCRDAASRIGSSVASAMAISAPAEGADESGGTSSGAIQLQIDGIYDDVHGALLACASGLGAVSDAERSLRYALSDSLGYARLSGIKTSASTTLVDAVMALADGVDDPDYAVVSDAEWAAYLREREGMDDADRTRFDEALAGARTPEERQILISALASGAGLSLALALAGRLRSMSASEVHAVAGLGLPSTPGGASRYGTAMPLPDGTLFRQIANTTCGSTSLLMLAAQRDPYLAMFLATGQFVDGHVPDYLKNVFLIDRIPEAGLTAEERIDYVQREIRIKTNEWTFWPGSVAGSAPWGYADEIAEITGRDVDFQYNAFGDVGDAQGLIDRAVAAVDRGDPVPLLVGDGSLPRHYVLLVGHEGDTLRVYDPSVGEVIDVPAARAVDSGGEGVEAFGWWGHLHGVALPKY